jgi:Uma2 family endonuclease
VAVAMCYSSSPAMENEVSTHPKTWITPEEYLELERKAEIKSEYLDGEMFAMSGVTLEHSTIVVNLITELNNQFVDRPCQVLGPDLRVKVSTTGLYTYPDLVAFCGEPKFEDRRFDTLLNPQLIIEVLSHSTEAYDRGKKFAPYRTITSVREYVLVSQTECRIERFGRRDDGNWDYTECTDPNGSIEFTSVACRVFLQRVYRNVDFERAAPQQSDTSGPTAS